MSVQLLESILLDNKYFIHLCISPHSSERVQGYFSIHTNHNANNHLNLCEIFVNLLVQLT